MKKILSVLTASAMAASLLAGCGGFQNSGATKGGEGHAAASQKAEGGRKGAAAAGGGGRFR